MLFGIELLNFITLLYIYVTYGLYGVSELSSEAGRALQHFVYKFGEELPQQYAGTNTSAGYFGFGGFILAGCVIQLLILSICIVIKTLHSGSPSSLPAPQAYTRTHMSNIFRYYHISFLYAFIPDLLLCCAIVFKWIEMNSSVQSAYSWGIGIVVLVMVAIGNVMYVGDAYPYARIAGKRSSVVNPLPFGKEIEQKEGSGDGVSVKGGVQVIGEDKSGKNTNFLTI